MIQIYTDVIVISTDDIILNNIDIFLNNEYIFCNLPSLHVSPFHPRWHPFVGHIPVALMQVP